MEMYKAMLLSRDIGEQIKAVNIIYQVLKRHENDSETCMNLIDYLLHSDICVFLCEVSVTLEVHLLRLIYECFKTFSMSPSFYTKLYSSQVITSTIRTLQFLIKENGSENVICELIIFMSDVIKKSRSYHTPSIISSESVYNAMHIFELLLITISKVSFETKTKISIANLLHNVLKKRQKDVIVSYKTLALAEEVIKKCLNYLNQIITVRKYKCSFEKYLDSAMGMICKICIDALYLGNNYKLMLNKNVDQDSDIFRKSVKQIVHQYMIEITSQMRELDISVLKPNFDVFLELLNDFFNQNNFPQDTMEIFCQHLCSHGFLAFLGQLTPISNRTRKLCLTNLAEILSVLSVKAFNIECGTDIIHFKTYLFEGIMGIGSDKKCLAEKLIDVHTHTRTKNALFVYIYFNCLYSENPVKLVSPILSHLVKYIHQFDNELNIPTPILKCIWLIYSVASSSSSRRLSLQCGVLALEKANSIMSTMLLFKVKNVYTHSPYIVEWTYSSYRISPVIQNQVLTLWFENESTIPDNIIREPKLWSSLLDLIVFGDCDMKIKLIKDLLIMNILNYTEENDSIRYELWNTLPQAINYYSIGKIKNVQSIIYLMELCSICPPDNPDLSTIQTTASLLPSLLVITKRHNIDIQAPFIKESYTLLRNSLKYEDKLILSQYINTPILLQYMYDATLSDDPTTCTVAYDMLCACMYYKAHYNITSSNCIKMEPLHLIATLRDKNDSEKIISLLKLIYQCLKIGKINLYPFVVLAPIHSKEEFLSTYRALYFRLQMMCCKESKDESLPSWYCLNTLLEFTARSKNVPELLEYLTSMPWPHKLIHFYLYQNHPGKCHKKFLQFVNYWLVCHKIISGSDKYIALNMKDVIIPRAECSVMYGTICRIINAFSDDTLLEELHHDKRNIIYNILNIISDHFI